MLMLSAKSSIRIEGNSLAKQAAQFQNLGPTNLDPNRASANTGAGRRYARVSCARPQARCVNRDHRHRPPSTLPLTRDMNAVTPIFQGLDDLLVEPGLDIDQRSLTGPGTQRWSNGATLVHLPVIVSREERELPPG